jgi:hypothetical protein
MIIIQGGIYKLLVPVTMKTCVLFNTTNHRQENKTKIPKTLKLIHQNLTSQILPVCLPLKTGEKYRFLVFI